MAQRTPHVRHYHYSITALAFNTESPATILGAETGGIVLLDRLRLVIPLGHAGLTGIRFEYQGSQILPWDNTISYLVGDGADWVFEMDDIEISQPVKVWLKNTDAYNHTFEVHATVKDLIAPRNDTTTDIVAIG